MCARRWMAVSAAVALVAGMATPAFADDPPPLAAQCQRLGVLGDSLMLGSQTTLVKSLGTLGVTELRLDGQVARRIPSTVRAPYSGVKALRSMRTAGYQMDCYLVGLGTNDVWNTTPATKYQTWIRELLTEIGDHPVLWVNVARPRMQRGADVFNATLAGMVTEFPKLQVADWATIMPEHPDWYIRDKVHLRTPGRIYRGEWMAQQVFDRLYTAAPEPVPAPTCSITNVLMRNSQNDDVLCLETRLAELGYVLPSAPDTVFTADTTKAVADFQKAKRLTANGIVRSQTTIALGLNPPAPT